jgi:hypothetical protein
MRKRQKMVLTSVILSLGLLLIQSVPLEWRYWLIMLWAGVSWILAAWSLKEGLSGVEWLTVVLPSALFSAGTGLFYILLPESVWAKVGILAVFGIGQYALLLSANIFSVAAIRTIALFRAASAVEFVMTLLTGFLLFNSMMSFRLIFWQVGLGTVIISIFLLLPGLWSVKLEKTITRTVIRYTVYLAVIMGLLATSITFWPISLTVASLFLSTMLYVLLGVAQHHFDDRLFSKTLWEYLTVGFTVTATMLITAGWGM